MLWAGNESCQVREEASALSQSEAVVGDSSMICHAVVAVGAAVGAAVGEAVGRDDGSAIVKDTHPSGVDEGGSGVG